MCVRIAGNRGMVCRRTEITTRWRIQGNIDFLGQNKKSFHQRQNDQKGRCCHRALDLHRNENQIQNRNKIQSVKKRPFRIPRRQKLLLRDAFNGRVATWRAQSVMVGNPLTQCIVRVKGVVEQTALKMKCLQLHIQSVSEGQVEFGMREILQISFASSFFLGLEN